MKTPAKPAKPSTGPSQALIARIEHLDSLLKHLPQSLPIDPSVSKYHLNLDEDILADGGPLAAASRCLELCFETWQMARTGDGNIHFRERGSRLKALIVFMKTTVKKMTEADRAVFKDAWLERLIRAAVANGAKIPSVSSYKQNSESSNKRNATSPPDSEPQLAA
jgi:hypothetical protein